MHLIRSISGIRGVVGKTIDISIVSLYCHSFSKIQGHGIFAIARDGRNPGKALYEAAIDTINSDNRNVIPLDIAPTPTAQYITKKYHLAGAIIITASHNPQGWNGIKFVDNDGLFIDTNKFEELCKIVDNTSEYSTKKKINSIKINENSKNYIDEHIYDVINLPYINKDKIKNRQFRVSVDAINSSCSYAIPRLLRILGCKVSTINCNSDGVFSRDPEPLSNNLNALSENVLNNNSDFGIAFDPDGDRVSIVNNFGKAIGEEYTLAICALGFYNSTKSSKPIITNLSTSLLIESIAKKYNVNVVRTKIGERNVVNSMIKLKADFGGEGNGGVILNDSHLGRDAIVASILLLSTLCELNKSISDIVKDLPKYYIVKDRIENKKISEKKILEKIQVLYSNKATIDTEDGIKINMNKAWVHIRKSNTEPIYRIYSESSSKNKSYLLVNQIKKLVSSVF